MQEASDLQLNNKEHPDLYHKSVKGGYWVFALRLIVNVLSFVKVFVIVNYFVLENLGIISVALMMMDVLSTFTHTGFDSALVQKKEKIHDYLDTAWTAGLVKGIMLFAILYFAAPFLGSIAPQVSHDKVALTTSILRAMSICFLIRGVQNIGIIYFQKELQFRKVFILSLANSLTDIILSLVFIFIFHSIWGVIIARIISEAVYCAGSYILSSYRPRFCFELAKARELWKFGKWIYGQNILCFLLETGDNFFVWFYLGLPQLALYKNAYNFANMPATHLSQVISSITFPAYSKIQDELIRLRDAFMKTLKVTTFLAIPSAFLIFSMGPDFVVLFLKEDLHPMTPILQIFSVMGLFASIGSVCGPLFNATGKLQAIFHVQWIRFVIMAVLIYPMTKMYGLIGTALAVLFVRVVAFPVVLILSSLILKSSVWKILKPILLPLSAAVVMCGAIYCLKAYVFGPIVKMSFFILLFTAGAVYFGVLMALDHYFGFGFQAIIKDQMGIFYQKTEITVQNTGSKVVK